MRQIMIAMGMLALSGCALGEWDQRSGGVGIFDPFGVRQQQQDMARLTELQTETDAKQDELERARAETEALGKLTAVQDRITAGIERGVVPASEADAILRDLDRADKSVADLRAENRPDNRPRFDARIEDVKDATAILNSYVLRFRL